MLKHPRAVQYSFSHTGDAADGDAALFFLFWRRRGPSLSLGPFFTAPPASSAAEVAVEGRFARCSRGGDGNRGEVETDIQAIP